jgi:ankyrin repeat protein
MSDSKLPERASLEYLKKLAKDRLHELRQTDPHTKLAAALLAVARDHGFPSWRALKIEVEQRQTTTAAVFFDACAKGDIAVLRDLFAQDPSLVNLTNPAAQHSGWTGLHTAAQRGKLDVVRLLLQHGADPNAREAGDNTYPLHWAAAARHVETARALLDAGTDVHGFGDLHELDAIGWATFFHAPDGAPGDHPEVASLLLERGARHHIFSAISVGDLDLIQHVVEQNADALSRRMSRFEHGRTPLHLAIIRKRYDILDLLIELGADLEAEDANGHSALSFALMQGDREAINRLNAAGAKANKGWMVEAMQPRPAGSPTFRESVAKLAASVKKGSPMISVPDVGATLDWYTSIGFEEMARYADEAIVVWGMMSFGSVEIALNSGGKPGPREVSLWFITDKVEDLYQLFKSRQLAAAQSVITGEPSDHKSGEFIEDLYEPFYGGKQFSIRDLNGYMLVFYTG